MGGSSLLHRVSLGDTGRISKIVHSLGWQVGVTMGWELTDWAGGFSSSHGHHHRLPEFTQTRFQVKCPKKTREKLYGLLVPIVSPTVSFLPNGQSSHKRPPRLKGRGHRPHHSMERVSRSF